MRLTKILLPTSMVIVMISAIPIPMEPNPADISDLPAADSDATLPQTVPQTVPPTIEKLSKLDRLRAKQKAQKLAKQNPADISDLPVHQSADSDATLPQTVPQTVEKLSALKLAKQNPNPSSADSADRTISILPASQAANSVTKASNRATKRAARKNPSSTDGTISNLSAPQATDSVTTPPATFEFGPSTPGDKPETSARLDLDTMREATPQTDPDRTFIMTVHGDNNKPEHWFNIILQLLRTRPHLKTYRYTIIEITATKRVRGLNNMHGSGSALFSGSKVSRPQRIALQGAVE